MEISSRPEGRGRDTHQPPEADALQLAGHPGGVQGLLRRKAPVVQGGGVAVLLLHQLQGPLGGGGVDGAIHRAAGPGLLSECRTLNGCKTGKAKITKGYRLPCEYVIHTPGPCWSGGSSGEEELLASCYQSCLELAAGNGIRSVAFPSISTGIYRFPLDRASVIAVGAILEFLALHSNMEVQMVCFDKETFQYYQNALKAVCS